MTWLMKKKYSSGEAWKHGAECWPALQSDDHHILLDQWNLWVSGFNTLWRQKRRKACPSDGEPDRWRVHFELSTIFPVSYTSLPAHELTQKHLGSCFFSMTKIYTYWNISFLKWLLFYFLKESILFPQWNDNLFEHWPIFLSIILACKGFNQFQTFSKVFNKCLMS